MGDDPVDPVAHPPAGGPGRGHPGGDIMRPLEAAFGEQQGQVQVVPFTLQVPLQLVVLGQDRRSPRPGRDRRPHQGVTLQQTDRGPAGRGSGGRRSRIGQPRPELR